MKKINIIFFFLIILLFQINLILFQKTKNYFFGYPTDSSGQGKEKVYLSVTGNYDPLIKYLFKEAGLEVQFERLESSQWNFSFIMASNCVFDFGVLLHDKEINAKNKELVDLRFRFFS